MLKVFIKKKKKERKAEPASSSKFKMKVPSEICWIFNVFPCDRSYAKESTFNVIYLSVCNCGQFSILYFIFFNKIKMRTTQTKKTNFISFNYGRNKHRNADRTKI